MKKYLSDWKLLGGFSALLLLIIFIGLIGIFQINSSAKLVADLGENHLPLQKAVLEMRINNSLYAMGIRNYFFWKSSRYLEAARATSGLETINKAADNFDRHLRDYSSFARRRQHRQWIERIRNSEKEIRTYGNQIVKLVDKKADNKRINKIIMNFESRCHRLDNFLDNTIQDFNLRAIKAKINAAQRQKERAVLVLSWALILSLAVGIEAAWVIYRSRRRQRQRRQRLVERMIKVEEENKADLSLQVHDQMGQDLSAVRIYLDLIAQKIEKGDNEQVKENIDETRKILGSLMEKAHNISELLRPSSLDKVGLADTISALVFRYKKMAGIKIDYQRPREPVKLPQEHSLTIYRLAQEGLTNVLKHARAKEVKLILEAGADFVRFTLEDDGAGFDYKRFSQMYHRRREDKLKLGLIGLRERIDLLGGNMDIKTAPGAGTRLTAQLPK